jgi:hypothetical protein
MQSMLNRRQFTNGSAAVVSGGFVGGLIGAHIVRSESVHFDTCLPIPPLIDAAKQGNAVKLKVSSGRHAFVKGKLTLSYGYSVPVLGRTIRLHHGDEVVTVEISGVRLACHSCRILPMPSISKRVGLTHHTLVVCTDDQ